MTEKDFSKTETKSNIRINVFCYENKLTFPINISNQKFENSMDLLLRWKQVTLCVHQRFWQIFFHKFSIKHVLAEHKTVCLSINGVQSVKLAKGKFKFKTAFKQVQIPFKIYSDFECILTTAESMKVLAQKNQDHIPCIQACLCWWKIE